MGQTCENWRSSLLGVPWGSACERPFPDRFAALGWAAEAFHLTVHSSLIVLAFIATPRPSCASTLTPGRGLR